MTVRLKDIAARVGVSVPTVSRALAGHEDINLQTRQTIQRVAREMGYVPNTFARKLQSQRAGAIGLVLPFAGDLRFSDPSFSELLAGVVAYTSQLGLELSVSSTTEKNEHDAYLDMIRSRRVDGFLVVRVRQDDARIRLLLEHEFPFVANGQAAAKRPFSFVDEDSETAVLQLVEHLVSLGHTQFGVISEPAHFAKAHRRVQGIIAALAVHGLAIQPNGIAETSYRQRAGGDAMRHLLALPHPPTAVLATNDLLAIGAIQAAKRHGLTVGKQISITGLDDIVLAELINPPLTTVRLPFHQMGKQLVQLLIHQINQPADNQEAPQQRIVQPELIIRKSTGRLE